MVERIIRETDEKVYQPRIHKDRIKELYNIGRETGLPMTVLVNLSIMRFVKAYHTLKDKEKMEDIKNGVTFDEHRKEEEEPDQDLTDYLEPYQNNPYGEE